MRHTSVPFDVGSSLKATLILESDDELELGAPKRYEKLYLVTVSKSKSGLWRTAKNRSYCRRTWR